MINGHGDDCHQYEKTVRADFSSNVWFGGTPPELIEHLSNKLQLIGRYPEPDAAGLCLKIAGTHAVKPIQVLAFNGSVEAFYTIALAYHKAVSAILYPAFAEYEDACRMHNHQLKFFRSDECESALKSGTKLFWIGNPNNPDGQVFGIKKIEQLLGKFSETLFVIDEAYAAFIPEFESAIALTRTYPNLIVVRSLTKCFAIPGLRLGYVVASDKLAEKLRKYQQPWSVNALAQEAGKFLIDRLPDHPFNANRIQQISQNIQLSIGQLTGFRVLPAKTPYFLVEMQSGTARQLKQFLLNEFGILIRDAANFRSLNERYFRICTRDETDNKLLINALKQWNTTSL